MSRENVLGVVMAGGASRRMGVDKRKLEFDGRTLVERSAAVLDPVCDEVVISVQPEADWESSSLRLVCDRRARSGPLAGLEAVLEDGATGERSVLLLACDLPHVGTELIRFVLERAGSVPAAAAVVPTLEGRRQPLCALYRSAALPVVRHQLDSRQRSMRALLERIDTVEVEIEAEQPFYRPDLFRNLNEPSDLAGAAAGLAGLQP